MLEPPPPRSVTGAVTQLQTIGALTPSEQLTPLGAHSNMHPSITVIGREERRSPLLAVTFIKGIIMIWRTASHRRAARELVLKAASF